MREGAMPSQAAELPSRWGQAPPLVGRWGPLVDRLRDWVKQERELGAVLLIWVFCVLMHGLFVHSYGNMLPWSDEWELTPLATGERPLTLAWLWQPVHEHRAPLTRLEVVLVGWLRGWNMRAVQFANVGFLALGSLGLTLAARVLRGRSALSDAFLSLVVLSFGQYESTVQYSYSYAMVLGLTGLATAAAALGWPRRSLGSLAIYLGLVLLICLSGGPAGILWGLGLCVAVIGGLFSQTTTRGWKVCSLAGTSVVVSLSVLMLWLTPTTKWSAQFHADSWASLWYATSTYWVCWLGLATELMQGWGWLVLAVPFAVVLCRCAGDLVHRLRSGDGSAGDWQGWLDLLAVFAAALAVGVAIGYGRAKWATLLQPRYHTLMIPAAFTLYLLLVRARAWFLPYVLALGMAFCNGWNYLDAVNHIAGRQAESLEFAAAARHGSRPLTELVVRYCGNFGYASEKLLLCHLLRLRNAHLSIYRKTAWEHYPVPAVWAERWQAEISQAEGGLRTVTDVWASGGGVVEPTSGPPAPGVVQYELEVPSAGTYLLFGRALVPGAAASLSVQFDDRPTLPWMLPSGGPFYHNCPLEKPIDLPAGKHHLTIRLNQPALFKLDYLELLSFVK